jgi:flagellar biosynthesis/type III secretory pathway protein FliH
MEAASAREFGLPPDKSSGLQKDAKIEAAEEARRHFALGREQGIAEGRELERREQAANLLEFEKATVQQAAQLAKNLARERDRFLRALEPQVAKLALSIASRVLRYEAQTDSLFLIGAARIALGQLTKPATVQIRVPAASAERWTEKIAGFSDLKVKPAVIADPELRLGDCILESDLGVADIGVISQLTEISRGLLNEISAASLAEDLQMVWKSREDA